MVGEEERNFIVLYWTNFGLMILRQTPECPIAI